MIAYQRSLPRAVAHGQSIRSHYSVSEKLKNVPNLKEFVTQHSNSKHAAKNIDLSKIPVVDSSTKFKFFMETYGCQMNVADTDIVRSILVKSGHEPVTDINDATLILTNTCAVRENAESKVFNRLHYFQSLREKNKLTKKERKALGTKSRVDLPVVGVLGCMAERLKETLLEEESVDFVCGPDAYRDIPRLIALATSGDQNAANTQLSIDETYADIKPIRDAETPSSAFISIMRGCNNMCSFCIVPFTRGRERSRQMSSIVDEIRLLVDEQNVREIVLLGQNVNGYHDASETSAIKYPAQRPYRATVGFKNMFNSKKKDLPGARFADLLEEVSNIHPELRVRFTSPHPKDFPEEVLDLIASKSNICSSIHMPVQSGSTEVLKRMRRGYTREAYLDLVETARSKIPNLSISTDIIAGFCDETAAEHSDTVSLVNQVEYDQAFMFAYSLRDKTHAAHVMADNIPEEIKLARLQEIIDAYHITLVKRNTAQEMYQNRLVLIEGYGKKSSTEGVILTGRSDGNKRVVFSLVNKSPSDNYAAFSSYKAFDDLMSHHPESSTILSVDSIVPTTVKSKNAEVEYVAKKFQQYLYSQSYIHDKTCVTPITNIEDLFGKYVIVRIVKANGPTLRGVMVAMSSITECGNLNLPY